MVGLMVGANGCTDQRCRVESIPHDKSCELLGARASDVTVSECDRSVYEMAWVVSEKTCTSLSSPPMNSDCPSSDHLT